MKVAAYVRISRPDEAKILENQTRAALEYAARHGWAPVCLYSDVASGGTDDRPGLNALRDDVKARRIGLVVFTSLSRMTRGGIGAALYILNELKANGCAWHFVEQPILNNDADTPPLVRDVVLAILAAVDQEYRRNISIKTKAAMERKRALKQQLGRHPNGCMCPKHGGKKGDD